jgi:hypothetical protein
VVVVVVEVAKVDVANKAPTAAAIIIPVFLAIRSLLLYTKNALSIEFKLHKLSPWVNAMVCLWLQVNLFWSIARVGKLLHISLTLLNKHCKLHN